MVHGSRPAFPFDARVFLTHAFLAFLLAFQNRPLSDPSFLHQAHGGGTAIGMPHDD